MINILFIFIGIVIFLFLIYIGIILAISNIMHKNINDAKIIVDGYMEKILSLFQQKTTFNSTYNVLIGSNGIYVRDEIVNNNFEGFYNIFEDWYYECSYYPTSNVVCYQFRVYNCKLQNTNKKHILYRCRQVSEKALITYWHDLGIYSLSPDYFIATSLCADTLKVYIACNKDGFKEIEDIRHQPK